MRNYRPGYDSSWLHFLCRETSWCDDDEESWMTNFGRCALRLWHWSYLCTLIRYLPYMLLKQEANLSILYLNIRRLKGYATPTSRSCFCLHLRPKDDVVVSILVQGKSLFESKMLRCLYVSVGETPLFGSREWFPLCQNRNNNKTQAYFVHHSDLSDLWLRGLGACLNRQVEVRRLRVIQESR